MGVNAHVLFFALPAPNAPWLHNLLLVRRRMCLCVVPAAFDRDAQGSPGLRSLTQNHPPMLSTPSTANMVPQPPMLKMLSTLPTLPMLRMLPTDPMLQCEPTEPIEAVLPVLPKLVVGHL